MSASADPQPESLALPNRGRLASLLLAAVPAALLVWRALGRGSRSGAGAPAESGERLRYVLDALDAGIWDWDARRGSLFLSARALELLGYAAGEADGAAWAWSLVHPGDAPGLRAMVAQHLAGETALLAGEARLRARSGAWRWMHLRAKVVERSASGAALRLVGTAVDVTERVELRSRLVLADRMAALGTLAAGMSHEINNPLSYVVGNLGYALERLPAVGGAEDAAGQVTAAIREALLEAQQGAGRVRDVVGELKAFTRAADADGPVDLAQVVTTAVHVGRHAIRGRARVVVGAGPVPPVLGNEAKLRQVVLNLLLNAAQAMPEDARSAGRITVTLAERPPGRVALQVSDSGAGIAPEVLPRIFDPFFTTKPVGVGTGLGLAISHGLVTALGGEIAVESTVGQGTTVTVLLPAFRGAEPAAPA